MKRFAWALAFLLCAAGKPALPKKNVLKVEATTEVYAYDAKSDSWTAKTK